ncbi:methyl-accepting chemotaxis protein [Paenibacillus sp. PL91]|uniref:methyl-accepting chemotaxis protein n=1 Tax=Paenibacillus sp. PL91 TaxID=2729538 RepID=UPI00145E0683|nr:methyl-accepting chemotaxis protein [Paenibacillus sp. PL91]MBC9205050.1 hypothetical protein [Paenibacillus sp. PL91]
MAAFISQSRQTADHVVFSSDTVSEQTKESSQTYIKILDSFNNIAIGAREQMKTTGEAAVAMEELSNGMMQIADSTSRVEALSTATEQQAVKGNDLLQQAESQMLILKRTFLLFTNLVTKLAKQSQDINQIIDVIKSISAQTNLLSLNAGIEAARAGEHGKGFAVVANEIRKLAEQTSSSSDHIYRIVDGIQHETGLTVATVGVGRTEMDATAETVKVAREIFEEILRATMDISKQSQEVNVAIEEISAGSEEISASVTDLADIARMACTRIDEVVDEAETEKQRTVEIMKSAMKMNEETLRLRQQISVYKV